MTITRRADGMAKVPNWPAPQTSNPNFLSEELSRHHAMTAAGLVEEIGEGRLYLNGNGQGLDAIKTDPIVRQNRPGPYKESGFDTAHVSRYEGTDFLQWYGRRRDGCFHPWGKIMRLTKAGKATISR